MFTSCLCQQNGIVHRKGTFDLHHILVLHQGQVDERTVKHFQVLIVRGCWVLYFWLVYSGCRSWIYVLYLFKLFVQIFEWIWTFEKTAPIFVGFGFLVLLWLLDFYPFWDWADRFFFILALLGVRPGLGLLLFLWHFLYHLLLLFLLRYRLLSNYILLLSIGFLDVFPQRFNCLYY